MTCGSLHCRIGKSPATRWHCQNSDGSQRWAEINLHAYAPRLFEWRSFSVRYWSLEALRTEFEKKIGPPTLTAEAFGGLGLLYEDRNHVSTKARALIAISGLLKEASIFIRLLIHFADSVYVVSTKT